MKDKKHFIRISARTLFIEDIYIIKLRFTLNFNELLKAEVENEFNFILTKHFIYKEVIFYKQRINYWKNKTIENSKFILKQKLEDKLQTKNTKGDSRAVLTALKRRKI